MRCAKRLAWLLAALVMLVACGDSDETASGAGKADAENAALGFYNRAERDTNGGQAQPGRVVDSRVEGRCGAVAIAAPEDSGGHISVVVMTRGSPDGAGEPADSGEWALLGIRDDTLEHFDASKGNCGFS